MPPDIVTVVERARRGDRSAWAILYDRFAPLVRAVCYDRTGNWHATWDVAQEVFLAVIQDLDGLEEPRRFQPWLLAITRHKVADDLRSRSGSRANPTSCDVERFAWAVDPAELEVQQQVRDAIARLPWKQRVAVQLFYFEGLSSRQITELLGIPLRTVYAHLSEARQMLRHRLDGSGPEACR